MLRDKRCLGRPATCKLWQRYPCNNGCPETRNINRAIDHHLDPDSEQQPRTLARSRPKQDRARTLILAAESDYTPPTQAAPAKSPHWVTLPTAIIRADLQKRISNPMSMSAVKAGNRTSNLRPVSTHFGRLQVRVPALRVAALGEVSLRHLSGNTRSVEPSRGQAVEETKRWAGKQNYVKLAARHHVRHTEREVTRPTPGNQCLRNAGTWVE